MYVPYFKVFGGLGLGKGTQPLPDRPTRVQKSRPLALARPSSPTAEPACGGTKKAVARKAQPWVEPQSLSPRAQGLRI